MPAITLVTQGQPVANFSVTGSTITIENTAIDCAAYESDAQTVIEVRKDAKGINVNGSGSYIAIVKIPAKTYTETLVEDEHGNQVSEMIAQQLDMNAVELQLWPTI